MLVVDEVWIGFPPWIDRNRIEECVQLNLDARNGESGSRGTAKMRLDASKGTDR
jgi:hypothetical protein